jgi:hypothetical protein
MKEPTEPTEPTKSTEPTEPTAEQLLTITFQKLSITPESLSSGLVALNWPLGNLAVFSPIDLKEFARTNPELGPELIIRRIVKAYWYGLESPEQPPWTTQKSLEFLVSNWPNSDWNVVYQEAFDRCMGGADVDGKFKEAKYSNSRHLKPGEKDDLEEKILEIMKKIGIDVMTLDESR